MAKDYYQTLGLKRDADDKAIKSAYRKLAREHHPDVNPNNPTAEAKFKEISEAFQVLSDADKRKLYDQFGEDFDKIPPSYAQYGPQGGAGRGPGAGAPPGYSSNFGGGGVNGPNINFEELFRQAQAGQTSQPTGPRPDMGSGGGGGMGDMFGELFSGFRGGKGRREPQKGGDVEHPVEITFQEAVKGTQRRLNLSIRSEGGLDETRDVTVKIPALINDGATVKVSGKGASSTSGGPNGDLFLKVNVRNDPFWKREGLNLRIEVPVSFAEAALGSQIAVPTPNGEVQLKIPVGTQSGAAFRLTGRGLKNGRTNATGDLTINVKVTVPRYLTPREEQIITELAALRPENPREGLPKSL